MQLFITISLWIMAIFLASTCTFVLMDGQFARGILFGTQAWCLLTYLIVPSLPKRHYEFFLALYGSCCTIDVAVLLLFYNTPLLSWL